MKEAEQVAITQVKAINGYIPAADRAIPDKGHDREAADEKDELDLAIAAAAAAPNPYRPGTEEHDEAVYQQFKAANPPVYVMPNLFKSIILKSHNADILKHVAKDSFEDRAFGCILGSFIGDSCGSFFAKSPKIASEAEMDEVMEMPGGGEWGVGSGQVTAESELAMCLMWGLVEANQEVDV